MTGHGKDYDQLRGLVETFTERVGEAISQAEEMTAEDSQDPDEWRQLIARALDDALNLDDAGLRRKVQHLRDALGWMRCVNVTGDQTSDTVIRSGDGLTVWTRPKDGGGFTNPRGHDLRPTAPGDHEYDHAVTVAECDVPALVAALGGTPARGCARARSSERRDDRPCRRA